LRAWCNFIDDAADEGRVWCERGAIGSQAAAAGQ
jgi:hypothetical protein